MPLAALAYYLNTSQQKCELAKENPGGTEVGFRTWTFQNREQNPVRVSNVKLAAKCFNATWSWCVVTVRAVIYGQDAVPQSSRQTRNFLCEKTLTSSKRQPKPRTESICPWIMVRPLAGSCRRDRLSLLERFQLTFSSEALFTFIHKHRQQGWPAHSTYFM